MTNNKSKEINLIKINNLDFIDIVLNDKWKSMIGTQKVN